MVDECALVNAAREIELQRRLGKNALSRAAFHRCRFNEGKNDERRSCRDRKDGSPRNTRVGYAGCRGAGRVVPSGYGLAMAAGAAKSRSCHLDFRAWAI